MAHDTLYAIGEALIDMIPAETGCDFGAVSSFAPRVGGAPANVAAAFARLGGRSALLTQLGDDPCGAQLTAANTWAVLGAGAVGALAYTFTDTFWFSAVEGEVYALSSMFTALVVWLMLKWEEQADEPHASRWIVLIA